MHVISRHAPYNSECIIIFCICGSGEANHDPINAFTSVVARAYFMNFHFPRNQYLSRARKVTTQYSIIFCMHNLRQHKQCIERWQMSVSWFMFTVTR